MKYKTSILVLIIIILIPVITSARYFEKIENIKGKAIIAEPIFKVENIQNTITKTINKETSIEEYIFKVKNFEIENHKKRISQVNMKYDIEIKNESANFPIKYELYDLDNSKKILEGNSKTEEIIINKDIVYEKTYKLVVSWENKNADLDSSDNIKIIINSSQIR